MKQISYKRDDIKKYHDMVGTMINCRYSDEHWYEGWQINPRRTVSIQIIYRWIEGITRNEIKYSI